MIQIHFQSLFIKIHSNIPYCRQNGCRRNGIRQIGTVDEMGLSTQKKSVDEMGVDQVGLKIKRILSL